MAGLRHEDSKFWGFLGVNTSISPFQKNSREAQISKNGFFSIYGSYSTYEKRKGRTRINSVAADGAIVGVYNYRLDSVDYLSIYTDNNTLYDVNLSTGALTAFAYGLTDYPTALTMGDRIYFNNEVGDDVVIDDCEAIGDWVGFDLTVGATFELWTTANGGTYSLKNERFGKLELGMYNSSLSLNLRSKYLEFDIYIEDNDAGIANMDTTDYVKIIIGVDAANAEEIYLRNEDFNTSAGYVKGWNHIKVDASLSHATIGSGCDVNTQTVGYLSITATTTLGTFGEIVAVDNIKSVPKYNGIVFSEDNVTLNSIADSGTPNNVIDLALYDGRQFAMNKDTIYWSNPNAGYDYTNSSTPSIEIQGSTVKNSAIVTVDDTKLLSAGMSVGGYGIPAATTVLSIEDTNTLTISNAIDNNDYAVWKGLISFGSVSTIIYSGVARTSAGTYYLDGISHNFEGVAVNDVVSGTGIQAGTIVTERLQSGSYILLLIDLAPTVLSTVYDYTFTNPSGSDIILGGEDSSNMKIDSTIGNDNFIGCETLGEYLILFKEHSIYRLIHTNDTTIPYRVKPVYTGGASEIGIGCVSKRTIKHASLGTIEGKENYGAQEYLLFESKHGTYAIGEYGGPIKISDRVKDTINAIPEDKREYMFAINYPTKRQYWLAYPAATDYCDNQLVYGLGSKQWSYYDFSGLTALATYVASDKTYVIMGDKDGFLYKHDYQTTDALSHYRDQDAAGAYTGIDWQWQGVFNAYSGLGRSTEIEETFLIAGKTTTDCPITIEVENEKEDSITESFSTTGSSEWVIGRVRTKLPGLFHRHKFSNSVDQQSAKLYLWSTYPYNQRGTQ